LRTFAGADLSLVQALVHDHRQLAGQVLCQLVHANRAWADDANQCAHKVYLLHADARRYASLARAHGLIVATPLPKMVMENEGDYRETLLPSDGRFMVHVSRHRTDQPLEYHVRMSLVEIVSGAVLVVAESDCKYQDDDAITIKICPDGKMVGSGNTLFDFAQPRAFILATG
jgi:hypothetical protein